MPASCTALTLVEAAVTPAPSAWNEQSNDASGNVFKNDGNTLLYVRNTTAGALVVTFVADVYGVERTVWTTSIPGSGTNNGVMVLGPFHPSTFNNHATTDSAFQNYVMFTMAGSDTELKLCPFRVNAVGGARV